MEAEDTSVASGWRRIPLLRVLGCCSKGWGIHWSVWDRELVEPVEGGGDVVVPGPVPGQAEDPSMAGGHELPGRGERAEPQAAGSRSPSFLRGGPARLLAPGPGGSAVREAYEKTR
ncbi:hypothetical protein GCM10010317_083270 [Streptomyces mirabilis]|nr:hypothetical protein GCM10010317_083270 [Streptomyces mirabilis]